MSQLTRYVLENHAKAVSIDLGEWLAQNHPPVICEPKWDGYRVFLFKSAAGNSALATKHSYVYTRTSYPKLFRRIDDDIGGQQQQQSTVAAGKKNIILDCEFVTTSGELCIFDVLRIADSDIRSLSLLERKSVLSGLLRPTPEFEVPFYFAHSYEEILQWKDKFVSEGREGVVVKNASSFYGQRNAWLKLKAYDTADCFVTRPEETQEMQRTGIPHTWFLGVYDESGNVLEVGKAGTYFKEVDPRDIGVGTVVEVRHQEVTDDLKFKHPLIVRVRRDKAPSECLLTQLLRRRR